MYWTKKKSASSRDISRIYISKDCWAGSRDSASLSAGAGETKHIWVRLFVCLLVYLLWITFSLCALPTLLSGRLFFHYWLHNFYPIWHSIKKNPPNITIVHVMLRACVSVRFIISHKLAHRTWIWHSISSLLLFLLLLLLFLLLLLLGCR